MDSCLSTWRMSIGCFYNRTHGFRCPQTMKCKFVFNFSFLVQYILRIINSSIWALNRYLILSVNNLQTSLMVALLVLLSGDVETNPGPPTAEHSVSLFHCNIRSIRNKLDFVKDNFLDFDILCFTETHLDGNVSTEDLLISDEFSIPYRKDRTNHGGGILIYLPISLFHKRRPDLEVYWNECIWLETKINNERSLVGVFYSPKTSDELFFNSLSLNLEAALEITKKHICCRRPE